MIDPLAGVREARRVYEAALRRYIDKETPFPKSELRAYEKAHAALDDQSIRRWDRILNSTRKKSAAERAAQDKAAEVSRVTRGQRISDALKKHHASKREAVK